jgi:predicted small secreted protein
MKRPIIVVLFTLAVLVGCSNTESTHGGEILE